jgi:hypothetical protein
MSILKDLGIIAGISVTVLVAFWLAIGLTERSAYRRGQADVRLEWQAAEAARTKSELERLAEITADNSAVLAAGIEQSAEADRLLAAHFASTYRTLENLLAQPIEVGVDCRRSYDAVRLYQQAAAGSSRDRGGEATDPSASSGDGTLPTP